jgi:uncharacterized protein (TIGR02118 family)
LRFARQTRYERGEDAVMVKAIYFIKRKPGMALDAFRAYWLKQHAEVVLKVPELCKYVQSHTLDSGYRRHEPLYDGIAELWYENTDVMRRIATTPESRAAGDDDANFIDMSKFTFILTQERVQKENPLEPGMPKLISFIKRKPGMSVEDFQLYWRTHHGELARKLPGLRRYVQCHVRPSAYKSGRNPIYDGIAETWFESEAAMREGADTAEVKAVRVDEKNFLAESPPPFIITKEHVIL